jgi:hypothetical protein
MVEGVKQASFPQPFFIRAPVPFRRLLCGTLENAESHSISPVKQNKSCRMSRKKPSSWVLWLTL